MSDGAAVAYVGEVVDFCAAADAGLAYAGAVDAGVGLDLCFALYYYVSGLDYFVPASVVVFGEAEAVGAYYGSILEQDVVSQVAEFSYYGVGVSEEIVAYGGSAIDDYVGKDDGVVSDDDVLVDDYVGAKVRVLADLCRVMDYCGGMDSGSVTRRAVEELYGFSPGEVGVAAAQHAGVNGGECLGYYDRRGFGDFRGGVVLRIRHEG